MLPLILQHVRELVEAQSAGPERDRYTILTPFPPGGQGWPTFSGETLQFNDPPREGDSASLDTVRAFEFFKITDSLYYDYSYGIRSEDYFLSQVCQRFFLNATGDTWDPSYRSAFSEKRDAFLQKYSRSTVGDLGLFPYKYTSLSPVSWSTDKIALNAQEIDRLRAKAIAVYQELENIGFVGSLIEEIKSLSYSAIEYDFGFFEVIREWIDPHLFEGPWQFGNGDRTLYGESDPFFQSNDVALCFAQTFYLVKNCSATAAAPTTAPEVREHRADARGGVVSRGTTGAGGTVVGDDAPAAVRDHRQAVRDELIARAIARLSAAPPPILAAPPPILAAAPSDSRPASPPARPGFVWVPATAGVPGHWERERAGGRPAVTPPDETTYRVAAIKCRLVPRRP